MLDHDDMKWFAANAMELNRILENVTRSSHLSRLHKGETSFLDQLDQQVEQATRTSQALFDRLSARILSGARDALALAAALPAGNVAAPLPKLIVAKVPVGEVARGRGAPGGVEIRNPTGERELILLVDDDKDLIDSTGEILEFEDYRVVTALDGIEALRIYGEMSEEISLVILDFFLPVMDGEAVFEELKAIDPKVRVVLSSGFAEQAKIGTMLAGGLRGFIPKPYTHEKLIDQMRMVLDA